MELKQSLAEANASRNLIMGLDWIREHDPDLYIDLHSLCTCTKITKTHKLVAVDAELDLETLFFKYQGENWSPEGEARELIEALGVRHTSMTVGDIVQQGDKYFFCDTEGWREL